MRPDYVICKNCKTVHTYIDKYHSETPSCYKCGRSKFDEYTGDIKEAKKSQNNYLPVFSNWEIQRQVDQAADALAEDLMSRHKTLGADLLHEFKVYFAIAANMTLKDFIHGANIYDDRLR